MDNKSTITTDQGIEIYESQIEEYLDRYKEERGIDDLCKLTQGRWNAALMYIRKAVFPVNTPLMSPVNRSMYDEYKVNKICDIYINLCYEYDKEVSINGFSFLTGIGMDTIISWGKEDRRNIEYYTDDNIRIGNIAIWKSNNPGKHYVEISGSTCAKIYQKLIRNNEETLSDKLISGNLNAMKVLPALNRRHNWNMPGNSNPGGEHKPSLEQIQQRYLTQDGTGKEQIEQLPDADF